VGADLPMWSATGKTMPTSLWPSGSTSSFGA
jgi:hypothetical protein